MHQQIFLHDTFLFITKPKESAPEQQRRFGKEDQSMIVRDEESRFYSVIAPGEDGDFSVKKSGFRTRQEARDYELSITDFSDRPKEYMITENALFDDLLEAFDKDKRARVKPDTYISYCVAINRFIRPGFCGKQLKDIGPADIRTWQNKMLMLDYSPQYLRKVDSILSSVFTYGVRFFGMKSNPSRMAGTIGTHRSKTIVFWTLDDFNRFIKCVKNPKYHLIYNILYWTGLRIGELLALTPDDIDHENRAVRVNKTYHRYHKQDIISTPKTKKSNRTVYLHKTLFDELTDYLSENTEISRTDRIFPVSFDSVRDRLERTAKKIGIKRIKIHDLRHSHASLLIDMNVSPLAISERLGHEKVETTLNIYSHLYPDSPLRLVKNLEDIYEKSVTVHR